MIPTANESNQHNYVTTDLDQILTQISTAKYGSEVRQAIYDGVGQAWENSVAAATSATNAASAADASALDAETALSAAQNAQTAAETAQSAAQDAVTDAQTAITNANTAITNANTAIQQAQGVIDGVSFDVGNVTSVGYGNPPTASLSYQGNGDYLLNLGLVPGNSVDAGGNTIPLDYGTQTPTIKQAINSKAGFVDLGDGTSAGITNTSLPTAYPDGISIISDLSALNAGWPFDRGHIYSIKNGQNLMIQIAEWIGPDTFELHDPYPFIKIRYYTNKYVFVDDGQHNYHFQKDGYEWANWQNCGLNATFKNQIFTSDYISISGSSGGNADSDSIDVRIPFTYPDGYSKVIGINYLQCQDTSPSYTLEKRLGIEGFYINMYGDSYIMVKVRSHSNSSISSFRVYCELIFI